MASLTPPVRTCVLRVGIKCCKGCQTKAKRKLLGVSGVEAVEYNAEEGLMKVSGDPNPETLLRKLNKWGKKAELVSVLGDNSASIVPEYNKTGTAETRRMIVKRPTKCFLLRCFECFGKRRRIKTKVEPYRGGAITENWSPARPSFNGVAPPPPPPMVYPPPQAMPGFATPIPYPPPYFGSRQPPQYNAGMFRSAPPPSPPYFQLRQTQFPQMVNSRLHYPLH